MNDITISRVEYRTATDVGNAILAAPQHPMDNSSTETMPRLVVAGPAFKLPDTAMPLAIQIAKTRLAAFNVPASDAAIVMIAQLCDRPGTIVLYCAALKVLADRLGRAATVSDLCEAFPMGFPDDEALTAIWDAQKVRDGKGPDNWLDRAEAWSAS